MLLPLDQKTPPSHSQHATVLLCVAWYSTTVLAAILSKQFMNHGGSPLLLTLSTFAIAALPALFTLPVRTIRDSVGLSMLAVAALNCCNNILTNIGLDASSIRLVYTIKSLEPSFTVLLQAFLGSTLPDVRGLVVLLAIAVSTFFATRGEVQASTLSVSICAWSTFLASSRTVLYQSHMSRDSEITPLLTFSIINLVSFFIGLGFCLLYGIPPLPAMFSQNLLVSGCGALAFTIAYNTLSFQVAQRVAAVTHAVNNTGKRLLTVLASQIWMRQHYDPVAVCALLAIPVLSKVSISSQGVQKVQEISMQVKRWLTLLSIGVSTILVYMSATSTSPRPTTLATQRSHPAYASACHGKVSNIRPSLFRWKYNGANGTQNFGDELSVAVVERILGRSPSLVNQDSDPHPAVLAIGSIAHYAKECDTIWGSGIRSFDGAPFNLNLDVRAVRGPLTRKLMMQTNPGLYVPQTYGDPALLLPVLYPEMTRTPCTGTCSLYSRVIVIPHYLDMDNIPLDDNYRIVPAAAREWTTVVNEILNATFVLSSSLHGIIVAEAFGIPARGFKINPWEPTFKYADYYMGTGRHGFFMPGSVHEAYWLGPEQKAVFDSQKLLNSFPMDHFNYGQGAREETASQKSTIASTSLT